ncbi:MAG: DUF1028 domain-containing protein [Pseudoxanthomonas sp.]
MSQRQYASIPLGVLFGLGLLCNTPPAHATWSIATHNPRTGTLAVGAASCSNMVFGIQSVEPGKGVVIVQAKSNGPMRGKGMEMLKQGASLDRILQTLTDAASGFSPDEQQLALLSTTDPHPRTFTGAAVPDDKGSWTGTHRSVQVNTMASPSVLPDTVAALGEDDWKDDLAMAAAVLQALEAGGRAGGDRRCGKASSATAFISMYRKSDPKGDPWMQLSIHGIAPGTDSALPHLRVLFERWLATGTGAASTSVFIVPGRIGKIGENTD